MREMPSKRGTIPGREAKNSMVNKKHPSSQDFETCEEGCFFYKF